MKPDTMNDFSEKKNKHRCLNCDRNLKVEDNFCPNCGQENRFYNFSFLSLVKEFYQNLFSLDSRFGRTIIPFLIKPGHITNAYADGKRMKYSNPVRLYLLISLFHFTLYLNVTSDGNPGIVKFKFEIDRQEIFSKSKLDSLWKNKVTDDSWPLKKHEWYIIKHMNIAGHSKVQISDSLNIDNKPWLKKVILKKIVQIASSDDRSTRGFMLSQIPVIVFFILPFYAFFLQVFFRKKSSYVIHAIHTLHIHSFFFLVAGIGWGIHLLNLIDGATVELMSLCVGAVYVFFSFKNVYRQKFWIIILKMLGIATIYGILLLTCLSIGMILSLSFY